MFVTNRPDLTEEIWRDYNQRACVEQRIEELKSDLAADDFCLQEFFATEAAFLSILMLFNLLGEFQRASGLTGYRQPASLRVQVFLCGAILGRAGHAPCCTGRPLGEDLRSVTRCSTSSYFTKCQLRGSWKFKRTGRDKLQPPYLIGRPKPHPTCEFGINGLIIIVHHPRRWSASPRSGGKAAGH
jgi:hypothetical protein